MIAVVFLQFSLIFLKFSQNISNIFAKLSEFLKLFFQTSSVVFKNFSIVCSRNVPKFFEIILEILRNEPRNLLIFLKFFEKIPEIYQNIIRNLFWELFLYIFQNTS